MTAVERRRTWEGVSWATYCRLNDEAGTPGKRMAYDRGTLEIEIVSPAHETACKAVTRLIEAYSVLSETSVEGFGSMTIRRPDLSRAVEPDGCYYVARAMAVLGREELDFAVDPPPDLVLDIDVSPPGIDKPSIYAALGVPEIWRYVGRRLTYTARAADGTYQSIERSLALPDLPNEWVNDLIAVGLGRSQTAAVAELRRRMTGG